MSRTINEIQTSILEAKDSAAELSALEILTENEYTAVDVTSTSKVSSWRIFSWCVALAIWVMEELMDVL